MLLIWRAGLALLCQGAGAVLIEEDTLWGSDANPREVTDAVTILPDATLTIAGESESSAAVILLSSSQAEFRIHNGGHLVVSNAILRGGAGGISAVQFVSESGGTVSFDNVICQGLSSCIQMKCCGRTEATIQNSLFIGNSVALSGYNGHSSLVRVSGSAFFDNDRGIDNADWTVEASLFLRNGRGSKAERTTVESSLFALNQVAATSDSVVDDVLLFQNGVGLDRGCCGNDFGPLRRVTFVENDLAINSPNNINSMSSINFVGDTQFLHYTGSETLDLRSASVYWHEETEAAVDAKIYDARDGAQGGIVRFSMDAASPYFHGAFQNEPCRGHCTLTEGVNHNWESWAKLAGAEADSPSLMLHSGQVLSQALLHGYDPSAASMTLHEYVEDLLWVLEAVAGEAPSHGLPLNATPAGPPATWEGTHEDNTTTESPSSSRRRASSTPSREPDEATHVATPGDAAHASQAGPTPGPSPAPAVGSWDAESTAGAEQDCVDSDSDAVGSPSVVGVAAAVAASAFLVGVASGLFAVRSCCKPARRSASPVKPEEAEKYLPARSIKVRCKFAQLPLQDVAVPRYWASCESNDADESLVMLQPSELRALQSLVDATFRDTVTRDRASAPMPSRLRVVHAHRVENLGLWQKYAVDRHAVKHKRSHKCTPLARFAGDTVINTAAGDQQLNILGAVDSHVNETYFWHGTNPSSALAISKSGFSLSRSGTAFGSLYGQGMYFAECSSKSDEYAKDDQMGIHKGLFCLLLCRVVLGEVLHMTAGGDAAHEIINAALNSELYDSVLGDRLAAVRTYREFVVFEEAMAYPEFIVIYAREFDRT